MQELRTDHPPARDIELLPPPEHGIHSWIFGRAAYLARRGITGSDAFERIAGFLAASGMKISDANLEGRIESWRN